MLDTQTSLHLANRLGFGPAPGELDHIQAAGFEGYLDEQLNPKPQQLPQALEAQLRSIPTFGKTTFELYRDHWWRLDKIAANGAALPREDFSLIKMITNEVPPQTHTARLARAVASPWRLHEALTDFWFNHFNVYDRKQLCRIWTGAYEDEAIRPNVLGKFGDLLLATARHPAMLIYLDNAQNVSPRDTAGHRKAHGINENYAREVMELHTLGVDDGYTQADVVALAHILTGWTVGVDDAAHAVQTNDYSKVIRGGFRFAARLHDVTPQTLLGRKFANADQRDGEAALLMLAHHPSTARHISSKLAQYFVADQPPTSLVDDMAKTFRDTDGDLKAVTRTMLTSRAFRDPANIGRKFKTPYQYVVSVARVAALDPHNVAPLAQELQALGQPVYGCQTPDGYGCTESAWLDPDAMMRRIAFAVKFGSGAYMRASLAAYGQSRLPKNTPMPAGGVGEPLNADKLLGSIGPELSSSTRIAVAKAAAPDRAGLILGSPDFMRA